MKTFLAFTCGLLVGALAITSGYLANSDWRQRLNNVAEDM